MTYELAKELKDAGFPQNKDNPVLHTPGCKGWDAKPGDGIVCTNESRPVVPTLTELIEACGEGLKVLYNTSVGEQTYWWVYNTVDWKTEDFLSGQGSNPEEAVAELWLALNKH